MRLWGHVTDPILHQNPVTLQILGICSALAVTTTLAAALTMSAALTAVKTDSTRSPAVAPSSARASGAWKPMRPEAGSASSVPTIPTTRARPPCRNVTREPMPTSPDGGVGAGSAVARRVRQ